ncbi:MAG: HPP family protein [Actinobacteria bacterium]|nr:HPP family protein [Actinomycetota bacterium]NBY15472.1 HPP family protein [Actinomycetota bacterium]
MPKTSISDFLTKLKGQGSERPPIASRNHILISAIGAFIAVAVIATASKAPNNLLIMGSFGGSCVLLFGFPDSPFAQPRNVIIGHTISYASGIAVTKFLGAQWWTVGLALAVSLTFMMLSGTVHPPAGANPVIIYLSFHYLEIDPGWHSIIFPAFLGSSILVAVALIYNNVTRDEAYPRYW